MDRVTMMDLGRRFFRKNALTVLLILVGLLFLLLPQEKPDPAPAEPEQKPAATLEERLSELLSQAEGAGKTRVLLTEQAGEQILYQTDEAENRSTTVLVSDGSREEGGLVRQRISPAYQGAVVLCQGANRPEVRLAVVNAVMAVTGLTSDKITVLKLH